MGESAGEKAEQMMAMELGRRETQKKREIQSLSLSTQIKAQPELTHICVIINYVAQEEVFFSGVCLSKAMT